jgi:hypothetical protein
MSDDTIGGIHTATQAHIADAYPGAYLTDWVIVAHAALPDRDDATVYIHEASADSPFHIRLGLTRYLALRYDRLAAEDGEE